MTIMAEYQGIKLVLIGVVIFTALGMVADVGYDTVHENPDLYGGRATTVTDTIYGWYGHTITLSVGVAVVFVVAAVIFRGGI